MLKRVVKFLGIFLIALLLTILFPPLRQMWVVAYNALSEALSLTISLAQIALIAILFAGLLVPLEALGWWAGWYGDQIDTTLDPGTLEEPIPPQTNVVRFVIYLDGIGQASSRYFPDGEEFLSQLASTLPDNIAIIRGLIPYSVLNRPLTEGGFFSFFWRTAERLSMSENPGILGLLLAVAINIRNTFVVMVSADQRYGPIYNQGMAQVMYNSLVRYGYQPGSGVPITLIGFSGGGQIAMGTLSHLKQALSAPIEVISLAGVISGNTNALMAEHLYHFVGDKDPVERLGSIFFPKRWKIFFLSYWNRAKRMGKISFASLGPVGHSGAGGVLDPHQLLPDGHTHLQQTLDLVTKILLEEYDVEPETEPQQPSNYDRYQQADFNRPDYYPLPQTVPKNLYQPIAPWMGRLILPPKQQRRFGVLLELYHAPSEYQNLIGQVVNLKWLNGSSDRNSTQTVIKDVHFSQQAIFSSQQGLVQPKRLNHWRQVTPLESLAGSRPNDDVVVMLHEPVVIEEDGEKQAVTLHINSEPVQISGRFYALVKFLQPVSPDGEQFRVVHYNPDSRQFDGVEEVVGMPQVIAYENQIYPSTNRGIEKSPLNPTGWYIYGTKNPDGVFVVQSLIPRSLVQVKPQRVINGKKPALNYLKKEAWQEIIAHKGHIQSVLLNTKDCEIEQAVSEWCEGDRALVLHNYGGIGGKKKEAAASTPIYFGHFAYGVAQVVREPLTDELCFDIEYYQVYTHNIDGLIAGTLHISRYLGDRQFGWLGIRPTTNTLIKYDPFTEDYDLNGIKRSALQTLIRQLEIMTARYRIGDGTGGTYVGPANNCSQDSNQALYAAVKAIEMGIKLHHPEYQTWLECNPKDFYRLQKLVKFGKSLRWELLPFGVARADWKNSSENLGSSLEDSPLKQLFTGLISWRSMFPRKANDTVAEIFIQYGASVWMLNTSQVGGCDPDIAAIAPLTF
ncbi:CAAX protease [Hapalosiphon sp. MRB220]|nr:CAAX protease [Hapalosiphon sp. MRB220]